MFTVASEEHTSSIFRVEQEAGTKQSEYIKHVGSTFLGNIDEILPDCTA
jgi:hypothetical protein